MLDYFEQFFQPSITNWLPFYWKGFEATARYTFVIDLKDSLENIYGRITANYRNNKIKKAEQIVEVVSDRSLEDFYAVQKKSFDRQQISMPFSFDFLKKLDEALEEKDSRKIFFAVDEKNQIHSALYLTWDSEKAYLLMIGDDAELRSSGAGILLTWHSIKYAKEVLQKKQFDFLGSMLEPVANIRRDFGAEQIPYFEVKKYNSKLIKFYFLLKKWRNQK